MQGADIESFFKTHQELYLFLLSRGEPTFAIEANNNFRRSLVLAIASYFEHEVTAILRELPRKFAASHPFISAMIEQKAIARQYHTYFDWKDGKNANSFFGLFGPEFREKAKAVVKADAVLDQSIRSFLELGDTRNRLVHLNYVTFDVDKTPEDIMSLFRSALGFVVFLRKQLLGEAMAEEPSDNIPEEPQQ